MTEYEAMHIIVEGFFHEIYDRIPIETPHKPSRANAEEEAFGETPTGIVRATLSQAVETKLGIGD